MTEEKRQQQKYGLLLCISLMISLLGFSLIMHSSMTGPHHYFQITPDSQGMWKVESHSGDTEYCQITTDAKGTVIKGHCTPTPRKK